MTWFTVLLNWDALKSYSVAGCPSIFCKNSVGKGVGVAHSSVYVTNSVRDHEGGFVGVPMLVCNLGWSYMVRRKVSKEKGGCLFLFTGSI
jgi:hypothetical protein